MFINNMLDYKIIDTQTAKLLKVVSNDKVLGLPRELRDDVRTRLFKNIIINLL